MPTLPTWAATKNLDSLVHIRDLLPMYARFIMAINDRDPYQPTRISCNVIHGFWSLLTCQEEEDKAKIQKELSILTDRCLASLNGPSSWTSKALTWKQMPTFWSRGATKNNFGRNCVPILFPFCHLSRWEDASPNCFVLHAKGSTIRSRQGMLRSAKVCRRSTRAWYARRRQSMGVFWDVPLEVSKWSVNDVNGLF